ncbi:MAG TPA: hypothetical protein VK474_11485, partial [Chthoniobacterales bacterium]|nr:hypothetical protein [Chthoniobacterales bacterium]
GGGGAYFLDTLAPADNFFTDANGAPVTGIESLGATPPPPADVTTLANISTRLRVENGDNVLIGGFIVTGTQPKKVIVRAVGPSLAGAGLTGYLSDPTLELHNGSGALIASNDDWQTTQLGGVVTASQVADIQNSLVAPTQPAESAIVATLAPGAYTAIVRGKNNATGVALVESYDLDRDADSQLGNISTRGLVQTGEDVMIGGVIILGQQPGTVIIRALGPSLSGAGIAQPLNDPMLELHDGNGALIASNDDWQDGSAGAAQIQLHAIAPTNERESALLATAPPGAYTAIVRGKNNTTGVALVEVYNVK